MRTGAGPWGSMTGRHPHGAAAALAQLGPAALAALHRRTPGRAAPAPGPGSPPAPPRRARPGHLFGPELPPAGGAAGGRRPACPSRAGRASGLSPAPWRAVPGRSGWPDAAAWRLATERPLPPRDAHLPHDANARAGMPGHAGFGTTAPQLEAALARWVAAGWPDRMAVETAAGENGARWGLGLQVLFAGSGHFGQLLSRLPQGLGIHVLEDPTQAVPAAAPALAPTPACPPAGGSTWATRAPPSSTGPRIGSCVALLLHRGGPGGRCLTSRRCGPGAGRPWRDSWDNGADEAPPCSRPDPVARFRPCRPAPAEDRPRHPGHGMDRVAWRAAARSATAPGSPC